MAIILGFSSTYNSIVFLHFRSKSVLKSVECDGVAEERDGSDEDFELCIKKKAFPDHASVRCQKADTNFNGINITIMAVQCNGVIECVDKEDEKNCALPLWYSIVSVLAGGLIALIISRLYVKFARIGTKTEISDAAIEVGETKEEAEKNLIKLQQADATVRQEHSQKYFDLVMDETQDEAESINQIKVNLSIILSICAPAKSGAHCSNLYYYNLSVCLYFRKS